MNCNLFGIAGEGGWGGGGGVSWATSQDAEGRGEGVGSGAVDMNASVLSAAETSLNSSGAGALGASVTVG